MTVEVGTVLPGFTRRFTRDDLARYAGASTDFNPIHYNDAAAAALGLPGVIAHGMLTMGTALRVVTDWVGDPGRILDYRVRFTRPVVVDAVAGVEVRFEGVVKEVLDQSFTVALQVSVGPEQVLGAAIVEVASA